MPAKQIGIYVIMLYIMNKFMSFETNITWDGSNWTRPQRRTAAEIVETSVALARDGLNDMGIFSTVPVKTARVCQAVRNYPAGGEADSAVKFDVNFNVLDIRRNKLHRVAQKIPGVVFHELIHCLRFEHFNDGWTLAETAASEGLAYVLGDMFEDQLLRPEEYVSLDKVFKDTHATYEGALRLSRMLNASEAAYVDYDHLDGEFLRAWTDGDYSLSPLERIGITAVRLNLHQGMSPASLMVTSPDQILEVLTHAA
jgi:hypothetical protein